MPVKKKTPLPKGAGKNGRLGSAATDAKATTPEPPRETGPRQMESFEEGMRLFHARLFQQAREIFMRATDGPDRAVAHRAGLHARMCEQRLESAGPVLNTPEEHYNYAVSLINSGDFTQAQKHLQAALEAGSTADHVLYALAACQSLGGDLQPAYENLKRAIELQPRNRLAARRDPDFAAIAGHPAFARLLK